MNKNFLSIGDIYGKQLNTFKYHNINESNKNAFGDAPELVGKGPEVDGYFTALEDEKSAGFKKKKGKVSKAKPKTTAKKEEDEETFSEEIEKSSKKTLNSFMSKSVFDKLYNKVLKENFGQDDDTDALGLGDSTPDSGLDDLGDEFGDEDADEDSVSFTLPKAVAQQLVDVLQGVLGGEEDSFEDEGDDLDFGDEGVEDEGGFEEDEEVQGTKVAPDKKAVFQAKSNKVKSKASPKGGKAITDVTDDVGTKDGAPPITALQGKSNQVPSKVKVGDFFN